MARINHSTLLPSLALLVAFPSLVACQAPLTSGETRRDDLVLTLQAPASAYQVQDTVRRWIKRDIFQYEIHLSVFQDGAYRPMTPAVPPIVLPQKGDAPAVRARFSNLPAGHRYRVSVMAMGNRGGTSADQPLNTRTPSVMEFDWTGRVVDAKRSGTLPIVLDPVPFSGRVIVSAANVPPGTTELGIKLQPSGSPVTAAPIYAATWQAPFNTYTLSNLKANKSYQVVLTSTVEGVTRTAVRRGIYFSPVPVIVEQDMAIALSF